jgi:hypothetical protein
MRITIFNGSPRGEDGNTHRIAAEFMMGAKEARAEVESVFLCEYEIRPCRGCFGCWDRTPGRCQLTDGVTELLPKFRASDVVIFASPLYIDNVTGIMKTFMDRTIPLMDPHFELDGSGEAVHARRYERLPDIGVISSSGFPEQSHFQVLRLLIRRIARNMQSNVVAEIYRGGGELMRSENLLNKPFVARYKDVLRAAGRELVEKGRVSDETQAMLEKPLIPAERYLKGANWHWDRRLRALEAE